ncbi:uncharacterized protein LOC133817886 [Humulus lupulus]|uniref:uncharacterized protein LOC133817886 n=1 Tax=Humulus lupulus TaxID=3486 RepID=UPI002B414A60|nr:uncharacterized protein LOC133817886 [Humulus lupulus]
MENRVETSVDSPSVPEKIVSKPNTPTPVLGQTDQNTHSPSSGIDLRKPTTPDRLNVPKAFKYPERYRSPTDSMMSPVTKNLLARTRKGASLLPPSKSQHKIQDLRLQDVGLLQ